MDDLLPFFDQIQDGSRPNLPPASRLEEDVESLGRIQEEISSASNGSPRAPTQSDFPSLLSLVVSQELDEPVEHIIIYLHQFGGNETSLENLARTLRRRVPRSAYVLLRGIEPVSSRSNGFYRWDHPQSPSDEESIDVTILKYVIVDVLISQCKFTPSSIMIIGHHQGGTAALSTLASWDRIEFGGVISIGGPLPPYFRLPSTAKARTPALILRPISGAIHPSALKSIKDTFVTVDVETQEAVGEKIPDTPDTLRPILEFFAHRFHREEWEKQAIVSFGEPEPSIRLATKTNPTDLDGGGIRGLGSLLILQELMNKVGDEEKRMDREDGRAESSFSPCLYKPTYRNARDMEEQISSAENIESLPNSSLFLPCHYFTYAVGTSTGGYFDHYLPQDAPYFCILLT